MTSWATSPEIFHLKHVIGPAPAVPAEVVDKIMVDESVRTTTSIALASNKKNLDDDVLLGDGGPMDLTGESSCFWSESVVAIDDDAACRRRPDGGGIVDRIKDDTVAM